MRKKNKIKTEAQNQNININPASVPSPAQKKKQHPVVIIIRTILLIFWWLALLQYLGPNSQVIAKWFLIIGAIVSTLLFIIGYTIRINNAKGMDLKSKMVAGLIGLGTYIVGFCILYFISYFLIYRSMFGVYGNTAYNICKVIIYIILGVNILSLLAMPFILIAAKKKKK